jgi:hypothetical protein
MQRFTNAVAIVPRAVEAAVRAHIARRLLMIIRIHTSGCSPSHGQSTRRLQWHHVTHHSSSITPIFRRASYRKQRITKRYHRSKTTQHYTIRKCLTPSIRKGARIRISWLITRLFRGGSRGNMCSICRQTGLL